METRGVSNKIALAFSAYYNGSLCRGVYSRVLYISDEYKHVAGFYKQRFHDGCLPCRLLHGNKKMAAVYLLD